jgi:hypothetical protein
MHETAETHQVFLFNNDFLNSTGHVESSYRVVYE